MEHHYQPGRNLETILDTIEEPAERAHIINEAFKTCLGADALAAVSHDEGGDE